MAMRSLQGWMLAGLMLAATAPLVAASGGSAYSIIGMGDLRYIPNTRSMGMGYTGIGIADGNSLNAYAPATWAAIKRTRLDAGFQYEGFKSTSGNTERYLAEGNFGGALLALPVSTSHGIVFVGGFTPFSEISYNVFTSGSQQGIDYKVNHTGTGGFTKGVAGFSYAPVEGLAFGASFDYLFGSIDDKRQFQPSSASFFGGTITENLTAKGSGFSVGALIAGSHISGHLSRLTIGVSASSRVSLATTRDLFYAYAIDRDTASAVTGTAAIPARIGIGAAYGIGERWLLAADYAAQRWSSADLSGFRGGDVRDSYRFGIGAERNALHDPFSPWLDHLTYRIGFSYAATYYAVEGEGINAWAFTAGLGIPISGETRLNISAEYGSRGTAALIKDNIFRLGISLDISELWFVQYGEE